jgi:hypothetical protein
LVSGLTAADKSKGYFGQFVSWALHIAPRITENWACCSLPRVDHEFQPSQALAAVGFVSRARGVGAVGDQLGGSASFGSVAN